MKDVEKLLIKYLKSSLDKSFAVVDEVSPFQMEEVIKESIMQSVLTNISEVIPNEFQKKYSLQILNLYMNNVAVINHHFVVGKLLDINNIDYCVLKGFSSAMYYENPEKRVMGDIDILVNYSDVEKVDKILIKEGYTKSVKNYKHDFHSNYKKGKFVVEIHHLIGNVTENSMDLSELTKEILKFSRVVQCDYGEIRVPSPFYHIVIMLFHLYRHYLSSGIGLRHILDWTVFISSEDFQKTQYLFWEKCSEWKLSKFSKTLCQISVMYFGAPTYKEYGTIDNELCNLVMDEIFMKGNFGVKGADRFTGLFLEKKLDSDKSGFSNFYSILKNVVYRRFKHARHNKIVFFCGMIFLPLRFLFNMILGKREALNIFSLYKKSKVKKNNNKKLSDN